MRNASLAAATTVALLASACGGGAADPATTPATSPASATPTVSPTASAAPLAACGEVTTHTIQGGGHLVGDAEPPVPYNTTPGTSGWHASGTPRLGVFTTADPLTEPELVTALEVGDIVIAYDADEVADADLDAITTFASDRARRVTVTPFAAAMDAPIVLNGWGARQPCTTFDLAAATAFRDAHAGKGPDA